ncbi:MAG TPA: acetyl-CoA carboxylase, carboxyltransferase subunit beta [Coriobacteriia bacterium]
MPISDWFKAREQRNYTTPTQASAPSDVPDGVWVRCEGCKHTLYVGDLERELMVCPNCGRHHDISAPERLAILVDEGSFEEVDEALRSVDPLGFTSGKVYADQVASAEERTGLGEAIVTGRATIGGRPAIVGVMDFRFIGASMGSVVGEKVARAFELALAERTPLVLVTASGGARMQEGVLSLMQMAKTAAAAARLAAAGVPYIVVLTNPTMGGVTASFATLGDVLIAEPGALIGFAGPRLVEQTIRKSLPKGFQSSEFLLEHGLIDMVVDRRGLKDRVALLLTYLAAGDE